MSLAPFAALEQRIAAVTSARLANVCVVLPNGQVIGAEFDLADVDPLSAPSIIGDVQITYLASAATLHAGDTVLINEAPYVVAYDPMRNSDLLMTVQLREVAA